MTIASDVTLPDDESRKGAATAVAVGSSAAGAMPPHDLHRSRNANGSETQPVAELAGPVASKFEDAILECNRQRGFEVVKDARKVLGDRKKISDSTIEDYKRKLDLLKRRVLAIPGNEPSKLLRALAAYTGTASFFPMQAAVRWQANERIEGALKHQDKLQRQEGFNSRWIEAILDLNKKLKDHVAILGMSKEKALLLGAVQLKQPHSKKLDMKWLPPGWRQKMVSRCSSSKYGDAVAVMAATGCRPIELKKGVVLSYVDGRVVAWMHGAKVTATSGQDWREMTLSASALPEALFERARMEGSITVRIDSRDAMRTRLTAISTSKRMWPNLPAVTAYCFRHALVEDLRESDWSEEEIAEVLGHSVADTQKHYGRRKSGGKRRIDRPTSIEKGSVRVSGVVRAATRDRSFETISSRVPTLGAKGPKKKPR
jgi:integrase